MKPIWKKKRLAEGDDPEPPEGTVEPIPNAVQNTDIAEGMAPKDRWHPGKHLRLAQQRIAARMAEVKAAYRNLALEHHPDKAQGRGASAKEIEEAAERFKLISEAYETLTRRRV